jgi:uncharacterized protein (DUF2344 family)
LPGVVFAERLEATQTKEEKDRECESAKKEVNVRVRKKKGKIVNVRGCMARRKVGVREMVVRERTHAKGKMVNVRGCI